MGARFTFDIALCLSIASLLAGAASGEWSFMEAYSSPSSPDHEQATTFFASFAWRNGTGNQTGDGDGNQTGGGEGNQTGEQNTTGNNNTNATGPNITVNITSVQVVLGVNSSHPRAVEQRFVLAQAPGTDNFSVGAGPWAAGTEFVYHFEAFLSNGTVLRSVDSWLRTPDLIELRWHDSYEEAAGLARSLGRPLLVFVYSDLDHTSEYMLSGPFRDAEALALSEYFVCLRVSADAGPAMARQLNASSTPCLVFMNASTGRTLDRVSKTFDGDTLVKEMRYILHKGPRPARPGPFITDTVIGLMMLGLVLVAGSAILYQYYIKKRRER